MKGHVYHDMQGLRFTDSSDYPQAFREERYRSAGLALAVEAKSFHTFVV
jgi:hypothetical protein